MNQSTVMALNYPSGIGKCKQLILVDG